MKTLLGTIEHKDGRQVVLFSDGKPWPYATYLCRDTRPDHLDEDDGMLIYARSFQDTIPYDTAFSYCSTYFKKAPQHCSNEYWCYSPQPVWFDGSY